MLIGFGYLFERGMGILWRGISAKLVSGVCLLMVFWQCLAFFIPISFYVEVGSLLLGWTIFLYFKQYLIFKSLEKKDAILWLVFMVISLGVGSGYPFILDHFGYYVPTIKWIAEFGLVKGITNLDWVLGQMSPWHIFQAGFSHFSDTFFRINVLLVIIFFLYIIERKSWVMLCFVPVLFFFVQSPSPDLPSMVFALMILNEVLYQNKRYDLLFAFSVLVFSIKPTMFWLPILIFLYSVWIGKTKLNFIGLGSFLGALYIIKNIWVFGYPLFPINVFDIGISWKPYGELFVTSSEIAKLKTFDLQYSLDKIRSFSPWEYIINWMFLGGIKGVINTSFIISLITFGVFIFFKKNRILTLVFFSVLIKSVFVLWFSAQYRFFIEVFFVIFFILFYKILDKRKSIFIFSVLGILVISVLAFPRILKDNIPSFNVGYFMQGFEWKQVYKPLSYAFNQYEAYEIGNLKFNVPKGYVFGFDVDLPVITDSALQEFEDLGIFPQKIGEKLDDGFEWKKLNKEELKNLREIIKKVKVEE